MKLKGRAWKFGDNISTDHIIPGRYYHLRSNLKELAKHVMEDADKNFAKKVKKGDFIVAGENFGMGSSREHAALCIKIAGVPAVLAKSFARIFYRNAINIGLLPLTLNTDKIETGDRLEVDLNAGAVLIRNKGIILNFKPIPSFMMKIIKEGGLAEYVKKFDDLRI